MKRFLGATAASALMGIACWCGASRPAQDGDATTLFRDEIVDAPLRLHVKESSLTDETRFAAAASGLSWRPTWNDQLLIVQKGRNLWYGDGAFRFEAFQAARRSHANKIAFAFALSLVLDPPEDSASWKTAFEYLRTYGADFDKALIGILASSDKLPLLYEYRHAAADVLVYRASPRLMPFFLSLANTDDRYLRSRAVAGLGIIGYRAGTGLEEGVKGLLAEPKETGISAVQAGMIDEAVRKATEDRDYRVRAAAALALGLTGDAGSQDLLKKLMKDRAYILPANGDRRAMAAFFPVREQAARSLDRWGMRVSEENATTDPKAAEKAIRNGQNITNDAKEARKKVEHTVRFNEADW